MATNVKKYCVSLRPLGAKMAMTQAWEIAGSGEEEQRADSIAFWHGQ
jgi:hypothetical protein